MNIYAKETSANLVNLLARLLEDKETMIAVGYLKIAEQDQRVIDSVMQELNSRNYQLN